MSEQTFLRAGKRNDSRLWLIFAVLSSVAVVARWPFLSYPLNEAHAFRQMQTTLMIREYMDEGLLQLSPLPLFGSPWQFPLEFPAFQWLAAVLGGLIDTSPQLAGRGLALVSFLSCAAMLSWLVRRWYSELGAVSALVLFLFLPFGFQWSIAPLIEFFAVALGLLSIVGLVRFAEATSRGLQGFWIAIATIGCSGIFLVKITTALAFAIIYVFVLASEAHRRWSRDSLNVGMLLIAAVPLVTAVSLGYAWTRNADRVKEASPYTQFGTSGELSEWNFGSINQRLDTQFLAKIFEYSEAMSGTAVLFVLLATVAIAAGRSPLITIGLAIATIVSPLVFFNLYYLHNYYLSAIYVPVVALLGIGLACLTRLARSKFQELAALVFALVSILIMAWTSPEGQLVSQRKIDGLYSFPLAEELALATSEGDGIVLIGCDWDPAYFFLSGRRGLMVRAEDEYLGVPRERVLRELTHIARCDPNRDLSGFVPPGITIKQVSPNVFEFMG